MAKSNSVGVVKKFEGEPDPKVLPPGIYPQPKSKVIQVI